MKGIGVDKKGDAVMVTAVLLLSVFLSVGSNLLLNYGEVVGTEEEVLHLTDVEDSLMKIRNSMLTQVKAGDTYTSIINQVTLGTLGNPFIGQARSSGTIDMIPGSSEFLFQILIDDGGVEIPVNSVNGAINYYCNNYYFNNRGYQLEGGGLFIQENGQLIVNTLPLMDISRTQSDWSFGLSIFGISGDRFSISGIESIPLSQMMISYQESFQTLAAGQVLVFRINSMSERAWATGFRSYLNEQDLVENSDYSITDPMDWSSSGDHLEVRLTTLSSFDLQIGEMEVEAL